MHIYRTIGGYKYRYSKVRQRRWKNLLGDFVGRLFTAFQIFTLRNTDIKNDGLDMIKKEYCLDKPIRIVVSGKSSLE